MTRINSNVQSLIAQRVMNAQNQSLTRSLERLSTGLRINSGRDDPSGLIASESLRATKVALSAAVDNARRADSVVSVAEGALRETNALLLELEDLMDRSANEGGLSQDEVAANQLQIDSILQSIDRISNSSSFNDIQLLNGDLEFTTSGVDATQIGDVQILSAKIPNGSYRDVVVDVQASSQQASLDYTGGVLTSSVTLDLRSNYGAEMLSFASGTATSAIAFSINANTDMTGIQASANTAGTALYLRSVEFGSDAFISIDVLDGDFDTTSGTTATGLDHGVDGTVIINGATATVNGLKAKVNSGSLNIEMTLSETFAQQTTTPASFQITGGGALFAIAPQVGLTGQESIGIRSISTTSLGSQLTGRLSTLASGQTNDLRSRNFSVGQRIVREAIDQVSSLRGRIGAFQKDTLDTTINSLLVTNENITAAESAIRDADFAVETSAMTRAQILVNSSMLVLQAANQQPASILKLLGG